MVGYLPLATTALAALFAGALFERWWRKRAAHLFWWGLGVLCYGLGTALEGTITLMGSSVGLVKAWYVAGALLGAWPLSQGTAFLLLRHRTALRLTRILVPVVCIGAALVIFSPVDASRLAANRPSPAILLWSVARAFAPLINVYAAVLLVGGAALSSIRFARRGDAPGQAVGNVLIAIGALLPAIGGSIARHGAVEPLYVTEFLGLVLIGAGYLSCIRTSGRRADAPA